MAAAWTNDGSGAGPTTLRRLDWQTGRLVRAVSLRPADTYLNVLAAGPWGILASAVSTTHACQQGRCSTRLALLSWAGRTRWSVALPVDHGDLGFILSPVLVRLAGVDELLLGPPGPAVRWGSPAPAAPAAGWPGYAEPVAVAPSSPARGPVAAYPVFEQGVPVAAHHPIVVSAAEAGSAIPLTVSPVTAAGAPVASPAFVGVALSANAAGGTNSSANGMNQVAIGQGQSSASFTFTPKAAGSYVVTAGPGGFGRDPSDIAPAVPALVEAGSTFQVGVEPRDPDGVSYPLAVSLTVAVQASGGVRQPPAAAKLAPDGICLATFRADGAPDSQITFETLMDGHGQPYGQGSARAWNAIVAAPAPWVAPTGEETARFRSRCSRPPIAGRSPTSCTRRRPGRLGPIRSARCPSSSSTRRAKASPAPR